MALITQAAFAREQGVSPQAVTKWVERGLIVFVGKLVDSDASLKKLERHRSRNSTASSKTVDGCAAENESPTEAAERILRELGADMDMEEAKRVKENFLALLNKLEYEKKSGTLIDIEAARRILFEEARKQRDAWLNWPMKIAPMIAADLGIEADRITELLNRYVHQQISQLGEMAANLGGD